MMPHKGNFKYREKSAKQTCRFLDLIAHFRGEYVETLNWECICAG